MNRSILLTSPCVIPLAIKALTPLSVLWNSWFGQWVVLRPVSKAFALGTLTNVASDAQTVSWAILVGVMGILVVTAVTDQVQGLNLVSHCR